MEEKYKKLRRFNLTKVLFEEVAKKGNSDSLHSIFNTIDYSQKSELSYSLKLTNRNLNISVNESLAQNFVHNIPFEYYKQYVTKDWIGYGKDNDFPIAYEFIKNTDFLNHLADIGYNKKDAFNYEYEKKFLRHILDINRIISFYKNNYDELTNEDLFKSYFSLFKKCRLQFLEIKNEQLKCYDEFKKSIFKDDGLWLFEIDKMQRNFNMSSDISYIKDFINSLVKNPLANVILEDCFIQVKTKTKKIAQELSNFMISDTELVLAAFEGKNEFFLTKLIEEHNVPIEKIWKIFDDKLSSIIRNSYIVEDEDLRIVDSKNFFHMNKNGETFLWLKEKFGFGNYEFKNVAVLSMFENANIKDFVRNHVDLKFRGEKIFLSGKECILLSLMLNSFIDTKIKVDENLFNFIGQKLNELNLDNIQYKDENYLNVMKFSNKHVFPQMLKHNNKLQLETINSQCEKWSYQFFLDIKLIEKKEIKSVKIKI